MNKRVGKLENKDEQDLQASVDRLILLLKNNRNIYDSPSHEELKSLREDINRINDSLNKLNDRYNKMDKKYFEFSRQLESLNQLVTEMDEEESSSKEKTMSMIVDIIKLVITALVTYWFTKIQNW